MHVMIPRGRNTSIRHRILALSSFLTEHVPNAWLIYRGFRHSRKQRIIHPPQQHIENDSNRQAMVVPLQSSRISTLPPCDSACIGL